MGVIVLGIVLMAVGSGVSRDAIQKFDAQKRYGSDTRFLHTNRCGGRNIGYSLFVAYRFGRLRMEG